MKSKFKTLLGTVLSLILVLTSIGFSFAEDEVKAPEKKYHLDIGVVSVIYQNGKWDMGRVYGQTLKVNPKLSFNEDVKVTRILTLDEAENEGILWNKLTSHNIVSTLKGEDTKRKYEWNFDPSASASITNAKMIKAEGKNISYSVDVLLKEKDKVVNMMELYEHDCKKNGEKFASEVYKYWGGEEGLKAENMTMYNTVQSIRKGKVPSGIFYLIFVPTIIEYEVAAPDEKDEINIVPEEIENPYGSCSDKISWTETESHTYTVRKTRSDGSSYSVTRTCNHKYTYEAKLATMASLKSEKPNGGATLLKSGYGFSIILNNSITVKQISDSGSCGKSRTKAYKQTVRPPALAEVRTNWTVKNAKLNQVQPKTVALEKSSEEGLKSSFITAQNPVSHHKNRQIYTDVALKGTAKKPVKHKITAYTYGGGVGSKPFCKSVALEFTINGNMYEDDATTDRTYNSTNKK